MFVRDEVPVAAGFEAARHRLGKLDGWFLSASDDAYREGITGLTRVGPVGAAPGISRLVEVRCRHLAERDGQAGCALRWEVHGPASGLFPVLDADLILTPVTENTSLLTLTGTYRPPLGSLGAGIDRLILYRVAQATILDFLKRAASALALPPANVA